MILPPIMILAFLGILFGIGLYIASKLFFVKIDPRVDEIVNILPGANCGACGLAGCSALAKAIVHGDLGADACLPGGEHVTEEVAHIMGVKASVKEKQVAIVKCQRKEATLKYEYEGEKTCRSANLFHKGPYSCGFGCIGFGDCEFVCPFDAIEMIDGLPVIDEEKCTACGKCVEVCPKNIIELKSVKKFVHVLCLSKEPARIAMKSCKAACIACKKCEKECPFDAIHVEGKLAIIDFEKCTSCGKCAKVCPTGVILNFRSRRKKR